MRHQLLKSVLTKSFAIFVLELWFAAASNAVPLTLYDTGVDDTGAIRGFDAAELHYTLVSTPSGASSGVVTGDQVTSAQTAGNQQTGIWLADTATASWISPTTDTDAGNYVYRTTFSLSGLDPSTATISGDWAGDDNGINILLNGVAVGDATTNGFIGLTPFTLSNGFIPGVNTLDFVVQNIIGPTGLFVDSLTGSATAAIPEPATLTVFAIGLLATGLIRRFRR